MRYTTVIDLTEYQEIWDNPNAVRLYFYMAMKCGYHDDDRDKIRASIRCLALRSGITVSACRHALGVLTRHKLIVPGDGSWWTVVKFVIEQQISTRAKTKQQEQQQAIQAERDAQNRALQAQMEKERKQRMDGTVDDPAAFVKMYEEYQSAPNTALRRAFLARHADTYKNYKKAL